MFAAFLDAAFDLDVLYLGVAISYLSDLFILTEGFYQKPYIPSMIAP